MHRNLIVAAAAVAALGTAAPAAQAAFPGQNGPILFGDSFEDGSGIFSTSPGGTPSLLFETGGPGTPDGVDTTADGKRIAYNESNFSIWVANADASGKKRLTPEGIEDFGPSWSPDGTRLVFGSRPADAEEDFSLWTMNADGSDREQLGPEDDPIYGYQPAWSPDGKSIAFTEYGYYVSRGRGYSAIALTDPAGEDVDYLTEGTDPEWAPDGRSIVHVDNLFSYGELWRFDLDSGEDEPLTNPEDDLRYRGPSLSPDGKKIAAETELYDAEPARGESVFYDIGTLNADGSGTTVLAGSRGGGGVEWSIAAPKAAPAPKPQVQQQPAVVQPPRVTAPSQARVCGSRRYFNITVVNKGLKKVSVVVNGKKVTATRKGRGFTARVDLRKLPKGRFTVKIRKTLKGGKVKTETRRYRTCVPKGRS